MRTVGLFTEKSTQFRKFSHPIGILNAHKRCAQALVCSDYYNRKFLKITTLLSTYDFHGVFKGVLKSKNMCVMHFSHVPKVFRELLSINQSCQLQLFETAIDDMAFCPSLTYW